MSVPVLEQRFGHRGVAMLRIAVLEVLYEARKNGECIGAAEIGRRAGIFREPGLAQKQGNDYIVWGVLNSLAKDELLDDQFLKERLEDGDEWTDYVPEPT